MQDINRLEYQPPNRSSNATRSLLLPAFFFRDKPDESRLYHHPCPPVLGAVERDEQYQREAYARIDRSRLGELMGFNGLVENGYEAVRVATVDTKVEFTQALSLSGINIVGGDRKVIRSRESRLMHTKLATFVESLGVNPDRTLELVTADNSAGRLWPRQL